MALGPERWDGSPTAASVDQAAAEEDEDPLIPGSPCTMDIYCVRERPEYPQFTSIAAGSDRTCGLTEDGSVRCWGSAAYASTSSKYSVIDAQGGRTCGLRHDGAIHCFGRWSDFQLRNPPTEWGAKLQQDGRYQDIAVSSDVVCTLDRERHAQCWPINLPSWERWEHYDEASKALRSDLPVDAHFRAIDAGTGHVCGLREDSTVTCWGGNDAGQLDVPEHTALVHIAAGVAHTCALDAEGSALCWGDNHFGQSTPPTDNRFSQLTAGELHTCGLKLDGTALCWGGNADGQTTPPTGADFTELSAGSHHTCGLRTTGEALCWGLDTYGQATPSPARARFVRLFAGGFKEGGYGYPVACGLRDDGRAQCWGRDHDPSQPAADGARFTEVAIGGEYACGLLHDGRVSCWRHRTDSSRPATSAVITSRLEGPRFTTIEFAGRQVCGLTTEGEIACWNLDPTSVAHISRLAPAGKHIAFAFTWDNACSINAAELIDCWSWSDDRQFVREVGWVVNVHRGITAISEHFDPENAFGVAFTDLALSNYTGAGFHLCALRQNGTASCWGADSYGRTSPPSGVRFRSIVAGDMHTCGLTIEGHARCWGADHAGQSTPPHDTVFVDLIADFDSTCGLRARGDVVCWGEYQLFNPVQLVQFDLSWPTWHSADVKALDRLGIFDGTECTTQHFCTDALLSRATLAVWLDRLIGSELPTAAQGAASTSRWGDVASDVWWADHARRLTAAGVMQPCDAARRMFCPSEPVSRIELERILDRALRVRVNGDQQAVAAVALEDALVAVKAGIVSTCIGLSPEACHQGATTRGQAATVLNRFLLHLRRLNRPEFTSASGAWDGGCGRRADGTVECWGYDRTLETYVPTDARVLDVHWDGTRWCGTTLDRDPICSGWDGYGGSHVHESVGLAQRAATAIGLTHSCAVLPDQSITCIIASFSSWNDGPVFDPDVPEGQFAAVAVGIGHSCALRLDGSPACWTSHEEFESEDDVNSPPEGARYSAIALGSRHACGLRPDGTAECWGYDGDGRLTPPTTAHGAEAVDDSANERTTEPSPLTFKDIAAGSSFTCGLTLDGLVACWGDLRGIQLPKDIIGQEFTSITAVGNYVCVERPDGSKRCWGSGSFRRSLDIDARFTEVSANEEFTCGRRVDGSVQCWGARFRAPPPGVPNDESYAAITTASSYACGWVTNGTRRCWTLNDELDVPAEATMEDVVQLSDSGYHTCVLTSDGIARCWGGNTHGEAEPPRADGYVQISAGAVSDYRNGDPSQQAHTCAVTTGGSLDCWGDNSVGQSEPPPGSDFVKVAASGVHACALRQDGRIECWGQGLQHGEGPSKGVRYTDVVVGANGGLWGPHEDSEGNLVYPAHACGLRVDGPIDCWGSTYTGNKPYSRHEVDPDSRFTSISSGRGHVCGVRIDGAIECWGMPGFIAY
ncbi:MAG: hypothetical protein F4Y66_08495 [Acidimicrobiales bacterium]|nr:hypothetical protein [Acidimicrobiales bacterium]